jgi:hypothetical protein
MAALGGQELGQFLAPLRQRRRTVAGPDEGIEREPGHALGMALRKQRCAQRTRRDAVGQEAPDAAAGEDVVGRGLEVVGAVGDVAVDVALLAAAAVAFHVDAPADEAALGEPVHHRRIRPAGHAQIEGRLRGHRRAVHEQHRRLAVGRADELFPQEQAHIAVDGLLDGPVFLAGHLGHSAGSLFVNRSWRRFP